jgi:hypothetical protein
VERDGNRFLCLSNEANNFEFAWSAVREHVALLLQTNHTFTFTIFEEPSGTTSTVPVIAAFSMDNHWVYDKSICEVHQSKMTRKMVPVIFGQPGPDEGPTSEEMKGFPHGSEYRGGGCLIYDDRPQTLAIYLCAECKSAYARWKPRRFYARIFINPEGNGKGFVLPTITFTNNPVQPRTWFFCRSFDLPNGTHLQIDSTIGQQRSVLIGFDYGGGPIVIQSKLSGDAYRYGFTNSIPNVGLVACQIEEKNGQE